MDYKRYIKDPGIYKRANKFFYHKTDKLVTDPITMSRLKSIYTPPAWRNIWFSTSPKCHIQAHGIDASGKKQYILSDAWINNSRYEKYNRMKRFMKHIKTFKKKIKLTNFENSREWLIKLLFNLLIDLHIRVGNEIYAETNGSYGLTTLRQRHLIKNGENYNIVFVGKSNIQHDLSIPGKYNTYLQHFYKKGSLNKPLFFYRVNGDKKIVSSEELNEYLKNNMGSEFTCKDFRTYSANVLFIRSFLKNSNPVKNVKRFILECIDSTAQQLGHTRSVSRKSYISNNLLDYCTDYFDAARGSTTEQLESHVVS